LVVNQRSDFFEEKTQQGAGGDVADLVFHVLQKVALNGRHRLGAGFFGQGDGHGEGL
jgi:hypothetical protein